MINHWLSKSKKKRLLTDIDNIGLEVWSDDGTLGDFFSKLTKEQKNFLMSLTFADFICSVHNDSVSFELTPPN